MKNKKIGILGMGEIGQAIAQFYKNPQTQDLKGGKFEGDLDILNVCIPYSQDFLKTVREVIKKHNAGLVIIHSTVPVGTTQKLNHRFAVHSPVRGVHPNLHKGLKTFVKFIGADFAGAGRLASEHFDELGIKNEVWYKSASTELFKLLDTTYYGMAIAFHAYADKLCQENKVNFDNVMTRGNHTYNQGYWELKRYDVIRPVLFPPEGAIGGHCILPNSLLLKKQFGDDPILQSILRHSK